MRAWRPLLKGAEVSTPIQASWLYSSMGFAGFSQSWLKLPGECLHRYLPY